MGLGYVGLPLALAFGRRMSTIGLDNDPERISALQAGHDPTLESTPQEIADARRLAFTAEASQLRNADVVIITVPTPITEAKQPDLSPLQAAGRIVGENLKRGAIVVLESTVYPGLTDEWLAPLIEKHSTLVRGKDFRMAYSPERINPGDREHSLRNTVKVVAAEDAVTLAEVAELYEKIVDAGVFRAKTIAVAEAAKVIENTQRDLNIALMNELSIIFQRLGVDTLDVLETAGTKWNFLPFRPGLVGGHCIGVDPYYLTYKAETVGYHPQVILAGRRINDEGGRDLARRMIKCLVRAGTIKHGSRVAVLGVTFKENCPDFRNSRVIELISELKEHGLEVIAVDPRVDAESFHRASGIELSGLDDLANLAGAVIAVGHAKFRSVLTPEMVRGWLNDPAGPIVDLKGILDRAQFSAAGLHVVRP